LPVPSVPLNMVLVWPRYDGFKADIYSLGATLYTLAFGCPPFMANTELELAERIMHAPLTFP
jgi:serine/threonine protein kinase